jgi:hypothetical protein
MRGILFAAAIAVAIAASAAARAQGGHHGHGHADHHDWYKDLKQPNSAASCCDNRDCRPTRARMNDREEWEAWDGKRWIHIPPHTILKFPSPDNRSHLCEMNGAVFCFLPGPAMH